ncbi:MAG TPA: TIM44-like domain-containing protein [Rhodospirillaceae bacterium]|nr:TIM44-like domain-containing protein [Rhodospirillaceae bacterium]
MPRHFLPVLLSLLLIIAPGLAEAKVGKGLSAGSRSSRSTMQPYGSTAKPLPPPPAAAAPPAAPAPRAQPPVAAPPPPPPPSPPSFFQRHPFAGGLIGGLVGAGIGSMLFGGHFFGEGAGGLIGALLQMALLAMVVALVVGFFRRRPSSLAAPFAMAPPPPRIPVPPVPPVPVEFALEQADLAAVEWLLSELQGAWSRGDLPALQQLATPEMAAFFAGQMAEDRDRGIENRVEQVRLLRGDVNETWREGPLDFATVTMCWSAVDYNVRCDTGAVVDGDPKTPVESTELWTVVRRRGGPWQLSAIQQPN